jgi:hypothetical protein
LRSSRSARRGTSTNYSVLVSSLDEATEAFGQLYRDRGDEENLAYPVA